MRRFNAGYLLRHRRPVHKITDEPTLGPFEHKSTRLATRAATPTLRPCERTTPIPLSSSLFRTAQQAGARVTPFGQHDLNRANRLEGGLGPGQIWSGRESRRIGSSPVTGQYHLGGARRRAWPSDRLRPRATVAGRSAYLPSARGSGRWHAPPIASGIEPGRWCPWSLPRSSGRTFWTCFGSDRHLPVAC